MTQIITNTNWWWGSWWGGWDGDMKKSVYDPNNIQADAFDYNNFENTPDLSWYQTTWNLVTDLTNADNTHYPSAKAVADAISSSWGWDMLKSVYDPDNVNANAFDYDNFINTPVAWQNIAIENGKISTNWIEVNVATAAWTAAKVWTTTAWDYTPTKWDFLLVNFVNGCGVNNPTLNIDWSGAKAIRTGNANATTSTFALWNTANSNIKALLYYDWTYYRCWSTTNSNTTYSAMSVAEWQTGTATSSRSMRADYLKQIIKYHAVSDTAYDSTWDWETDIAPSKNAVYDKINSIDAVIPSAATSSNQLADKDYVNDWINSVTAYYITKDAQGNQWATRAELFAATTFYSWWVVRVPTKNDYTIVLSDEQHDNATTRYIYNSGWEYQYTVNETAMTQAQLDALNSWITAGKVSTYDWYASTISGKQDALSTQTAYTSKWTSTKVPTITTNTLWQVTSISETSIAFPVTSVNWQTWAVTISEGNTKTFYASTSSQRNTTLWQQIYDWIKNGNYAILQYWIQNVVIFTPTNTTTWSIYSQWYYLIRGNNNKLERVATTYWITVSSWTVTAVDSSPTISSVWDFFAPWGTATTWYVVTKTASGYEWQAPSGWEVMVSSQSWNILTSWMSIWAWTQSDYDGLGTYDSNTVYLTI